MKKSIKIFLILIAIFILSWPFLVFLFLKIFVFPTRTVQILYSPDYKQKAVLQRMDGIDLIFYVKINDREVYSSPDFAPNRKVDFQERLVWNKSGTIVVLEIAGRRLFGYDTKTKTQLSDSQLLSIEYAPKPLLWEYGFEGQWPTNGSQVKK